MSRLSKEVIADIRKRAKDGQTFYEILTACKVSGATVYNLLHNYTYKGLHNDRGQVRGSQDTEDQHAS
jgi:DNA invertase Pin-like site-specific DNA recombinase